MLDVVVLTTRISTIDFFYSSCSLPLSSTYGRCRAGHRVRERRARNIHRTQSVVSYQRASRGSDNLHKGSISNNICVVTPVNVNTHASPNVNSTNSSLHTNLFVNPHSAFLNFAVFNSRSVRNKIESIIDHVVENDIGLCTVTETWLYDDDSVSIAQLTVAYGGPQLSHQNQMLTSNSNRSHQIQIAHSKLKSLTANSNHSQQITNHSQQISNRSQQIQIVHSKLKSLTANSNCSQQITNY